VLQPGRVVSHYKIVEELSRGGMGIVYRATDTRLNRDVALKVLPAELTTDPDRRDRFIREARAASALEHPNIAVIHDVGDEDGVSFIAMELIRGDKLSDAISKGVMAQSPGRALEIASQIAEALSRAHGQSIVHRDLKPANVMLTEDGHAKVIDFGLAKLLSPLAGDGDTVTVAGTSPEIVLGTVSYMSPEQARGGTIDHRTDIFSFGILLYEMFSGTLPFRGQSSIETMHAIMHTAAAPLHLHGLELPPTIALEVQRIVDKCLAKDPDDRYQGMRDLVVDLKAARRRLDVDSSQAQTLRVPAAVAPAPRRQARWLVAAASLALVAAAGFWFYSTQYRAPVAQATGTRPSVAVMYFENNTGDTEMDWLRTGLTDMLVTDLSQSPDVEVLSTDRLVQILGSMNKLEDRQISSDTIQEVARRGGVKHVMLGSYIKAGETIRINLKLQDAATGRIISTERVDAVNEASLFPTMDELTRKVKARFAESSNVLTGLLSRPGSSPAVSLGLDRDLKDVTTSSMVAYREYAAGVEQNQRSRYREALPHFQKAVSIDPDFALAYVKMAVGAGNMGRSNERDQYAERALALVDRLTPRERYYIEGYYYSGKLETTGRAIEAYSKAIELFPDHSASRNNLAALYMRLDQTDKAIEHFEILRERGFEFPGAAGNLAEVYVAAGKPDEAMEVLREFTSRFPSIESGFLYLGATALSLNRLDEATAGFEKALALRPDFPPAISGLGNVHLLRDEWAEARQAGQQLLKRPMPNARFFGFVQLAYADLLQGRTADAMKVLERAAADQGPSGTSSSGVARAVLAEIALAHNRPDEAASQALRAIADARGRVLVGEALYQGSVAGSAQARAEYARVAATLPGGSDKAWPEFADAVMAIESGRHAEALPMIQRVAAHLSPGVVAAGAIIPFRQPLTLVDYWTARAQLAGGNHAEAAQRFKKVTDAGWARLFTPIEYVRSFYYLGQIAERSGDRAKAREYYGRFLKYWKDGDIDRDKVAEALRKIGS